jgi:putative FmdB family regulatory protein
MPAYDYGCEACGPFTLMRPMAEYALPQDCPECGQSSSRALLTVPNIAAMGTARRAAHATNERSAHAPRLASASGRHRTGCSCCSPGAKRTATAESAAAKSFPNQRPWMISH